MSSKQYTLLALPVALRVMLRSSVPVNEKSKVFTPRYLKNYWAITFDFSSDLSSGRCPTYKSEEKSKGIPIVLEIVWCEQFSTAKKVLHLFGASLRERVVNRSTEKRNS